MGISFNPDAQSTRALMAHDFVVQINTQDGTPSEDASLVFRS